MAVLLNEWFFPAGSLARDCWESVVDHNTPDWHHTGIHVGFLKGTTAELPAAGVERIVIPLSGSFDVGHEGTTTALHGRRCVFDGPTDVLYIGAQHAMRITGHGKVAIAEARTDIDKPSRYIARTDVPIELRGVGADTRQVHNFGTSDTLDAAAMVACEVITPAGNWSSHPAHKHDEAIPGVETQLEEIYYFEAAPARGIHAPPSACPFGSFATSSSRAGEIETHALVHAGDIALVPYGYHGPAVAAPEYDLYYLNVMAGPAPERKWLFSDEPGQEWIRTRWRYGLTDARLPYYRLSNTDPDPDDSEPGV